MAASVACQAFGLLPPDVIEGGSVHSLPPPPLQQSTLPP